MNERIKELAEQAGSTHKQSLGVYQFYSHELEKFAELIIKKCMDAVGDDPMAQPYLQRIKHAFGVEYYESIEKAFEK